MNNATIAWLIAGAAGLSSGAIAGAQHRVTAEAVLGISTLIIIAVGLISCVLPRGAESI